MGQLDGRLVVDREFTGLDNEAVQTISLNTDLAIFNFRVGCDVQLLVYDTLIGRPPHGNLKEKNRCLPDVVLQCGADIDFSHDPFE